MGDLFSGLNMGELLDSNARRRKLVVNGKIGFSDFIDLLDGPASLKEKRTGHGKDAWKSVSKRFMASHVIGALLAGDGDKDGASPAKSSLPKVGGLGGSAKKRLSTQRRRNQPPVEEFPIMLPKVRATF
eukprot:NODE_1996_length_1014_cov_68.697409_g1623_i0.p1 GENE.NODE_1996_length_1014_cov_68.697409_g1623_i0~~NODE_1996_length_1014_cov_68.697409_g1623_i0.p1  ORF type:complete len:129 (+),score=37.21 NODE_1996_length_1014_cov_68.697409_g1623_i0:457-843(+)